MTDRKKFKISDEQMKEMYLKGNSLSDIAKVAQDTKGLMALKRKLNELGVDTSKNMKRYSLKISKAGKRYSLDETVFDVIDTQEKAYWLGFLMADGYNHENKCCVALRLQKEDIEILEKFKVFLKTNTNIYCFKIKTVKGLIREYCELNICSPYFSRALANLGCIQAKTLKLKIPDLKEPLMQHFIRGYFDGDGCFSVIKRGDRKNPLSKSYQLNIVGMKGPLTLIQQYICENASVTKTPIRKRNDSKAVAISWGGKNVCCKILNYLYKDATIYLKRKHDKYIEYCISAK